LRKAILTMAAISLLLSFGCGGKKEDLVVAKVSGKEITVADFEETAEKMENEYLPEKNDLEGKKKVLKVMIDKEVMALKAEAAGYEKEEWFINLWHGFKQPFMVAALLDEKIIKKVEITEEEVEEYWKQMHYSYTLSQIVVPNEEDAIEVRNKIMEGMDFADAAEKYSMGAAAEDGGFIGSRAIGKILWWVEEALVGMEEEEVSQPLKTSTGYALLKLHKKREIVPEEDKSYARRRLRAIKEKKGVQEYKKKIEKEIGMTFFPDAIDIAYSSLPEDIRMEDIINYKVTRQNAPKLDIPEKYKDKIICQYDDGVVMLKDFEKIYESLGLPERPRREYGKESVMQAVHKYIFDKVLAAYAEQKEKILEIPEVAERLANRKERLLVHYLYNEHVKEEVTVTDVEIKEFYEKNKEDLLKKEKRDFSIIVVGDKEVAEEVAEMARKGMRFGDLVAQYSEDPTAKDNLGKTGMVTKGHYPDYDEYAFSIEKVGGIAGPLEISRGWAVLKLNRIKEAEQPTYSEAYRDIRRKLREREAEELLHKKLEEWRDDYIIEIYDENLEKAELTRTKV
jgi:parvulin-like peptidyl-prolyl isomerase